MKKFKKLLLKMLVHLRLVPVEFMGSFTFVQQNSFIGVYDHECNEVISSIYEEITFDESGNCFIAKQEDIFFLIDISGKVVFETAKLDIGPFRCISQEIISNGDGTYTYISQNYLASNGRSLIIDNKGKAVSDYTFFNF